METMEVVEPAGAGVPVGIGVAEARASSGVLATNLVS